MKKAFTSVFYFLTAGLVIYVLINLVHLSWMITKPEGFWGFSYFMGILFLIILAAVIIIGLIVFLIGGIIFLLSDFPKNLTIKNIFKPLGSVLVIILLIALNAFTGSGISLYISKSLTERYSYINKSEELIDEGKNTEALEYSKKAYKKYVTPYKPSQFFIISWLFNKIGYGNKKTLVEKYATTINYAFCLYKAGAELELAEKLYKDALNLSDSSLLIEEQYYKIFPYQALANINLNKGNYTQAERYFNQLLQYSNKSTNEDIGYVCISQEIFATHYLQVGDFDNARTLRENNVTLWEEKKQSLKSLHYLFMLLNATSSEIISQKFDEAGKYLVKAKPLAEKRNENAMYPVYLLMKGIYCNFISANGNGNEEIIKKGWADRFASTFKKSKTSSEKFKDEAETCFLKILNIEKDANGDKSIGYAQGLYRVASFYIDQGDKIKAHELLVEAKQICEKYKTTNIHLYYTVLLAFTITEYSLKGYETVKNNLEELEQYHFNKLIANYAFLTEKEREAYKNLIDNNIAPINSVYIVSNSSDTRGKIYNNIIATKEIALYANENIRNYLGTLNDSLQKEFYTIIKQRDSLEIDKNIVAGENQKAGNDLLLKEKAIQTKISSMPGFKQFDPRSIKWNNISAALQENEIAIEFVHSKINKIEKYYALVIKKDLTAPELIPLFEETALKKLLNQPGNTKDRTNAVYGKLKDSLYSLIWKPLEGKLADVQKAYISVSGILNIVSFPAILDDKNIDVVLLGSTRQVAMKAAEKGINYSSVVLVGGVNYGNSLATNRKAGTNRGNFTNLPFTIREVQDINKILKARRPEIRVDLVKEDSASEASFRNFQKSKPNLIHLATHGYYYSETNSSSSSFLTGIYSGTNLSPMLRSGIILAGANNRKDSDTENDGFLSAQEISRLNFANLDLVVLSACETGLGETIGSEGVFGLQRAFKLAGTKSLIMSLWKVPDEQTAELMTFFYSNYFNGMTKSQALKKAQLSMKTKYNAPFTWGGFILLER